MSKERQNRIEKFQNKSTCRVALLSITSAGVAITLTAASTVYFAELFWTPASLLQAEDRAHRIGQTAEVNIYYFRSQGTVDDVLWPLLQHKIKTLGEVFEGVKFLNIEQQQDPTEEEDLKSIEALATELAQEETKCVADNDDDEEFEDPPSKKQRMGQVDEAMMSSSHSNSTSSSSSPKTSEQFNVDPLSLILPLPPPPQPLDERRMMRAARIRLLREQQRLSQEALPSQSTGNHGQVICLLDDEVEESKAPSTTLSDSPNLFAIAEQENDEPPEQPQPAKEEEETRNAYEMLADCFSLSDFSAPCQPSEN